MPTIQSLKKKLKGISSTRKISKAMKTAATVKYSRLNAVFLGYSQYEEQYLSLYEKYKAEFNRHFLPSNKNAPLCVLVMTSNKGMCGSFNSDILSLAEEVLGGNETDKKIFLCGKKAENHFSEKGFFYSKSFPVSDVPTIEEAQKLFETIYTSLKNGEISGVKLIYPEYSNMMKQSPKYCDLVTFEAEQEEQKSNALFLPDKKTVVENSAKQILVTILYKKLLETALGAQAATLMTMRSAYDTANEYCMELESQINRKRQSQVTADVIETSAEYL